MRFKVGFEVRASIRVRARVKVSVSVRVRVCLFSSCSACVPKCHIRGLGTRPVRVRARVRVRVRV